MSGPVTDVNVLSNIDKTSNRGPALEDFVRYVGQLPEDVPVVIAGDFNECSHMDWTAETKDLHGHNGVIISWKNSQMLQKKGFVDTWRELYPSPLTHPGLTWPSEAFAKEPPAPSWCADSNECDRIDFVYRNSKLRTRSVHIVGSRNYIVDGKRKKLEYECPYWAAVEDMPWPSDHKGVRVEFEFVTHADSTLDDFLKLDELPSTLVDSTDTTTAECPDPAELAKTISAPVLSELETESGTSQLVESTTKSSTSEPDTKDES